jgi:DNA polymerase I-like protein with 3'-5' exonuclease and polymerase domains
MIQKNYTIVRTHLELAALKAHINSFDYFAFDTETIGLNVRKDKVIGLSVSGQIGTGFYLPRFAWHKENKCLERIWGDNDFIDILAMLLKKELLMWNASFDVRIVKNNFQIDLCQALLADIMLMKHTVDEEGDFALKKVAISLQKELGLDVESEANEEQVKLKENVAENGGSTTRDNYEMYKADLEVMGQYACADADLTLRLAEHYKQKLEEEGLEEFFYDKEVMPLYKEVTITMEEKGVHLNMPLILSTKEAIEGDLSQFEGEIIADLLSTFAAKKWRRDKALEQFPSSCKGKFATKLLDINAIPLERTDKGSYSFTKKAIDKLPDSPYKLFLQGAGALPQSELDDVSLALFDENNDLNINSKKQLGEIVFDYMGIKPLSTTDKGSPQFNDEMIQELADKHSFYWAKKLSSYNKLVKIKGTYIERFLEAQEDGIFYPSFQQHRTISGRYGSDLQQLPRPKEDGELDPVVLKYNNVIREFFTSGPDRAFIDDDYESLEPHTFAHVSGDEGLRDIFRKGYDFYSSIAIPTEGLHQYSADKKADNYLGKLAKPKRQSAKGYALGVPYGMTAYALGKTLGVSTEEAQKLIDGYLNGFPELKKWMEMSELQANVLGFVKSETGRIRHLPRVKELYKTHKRQLLDNKYRRTLTMKMAQRMPKAQAEALVLSMYRDYKNGINNAKNFQIQSLSASIVNMAAIEINRRLRKAGIDGWVALQIHDQLVVNVPESQTEFCSRLVQDVMENNYKLSIALKAPASIAFNLREGH